MKALQETRRKATIALARISAGMGKGEPGGNARLLDATAPMACNE